MKDKGGLKPMLDSSIEWIDDDIRFPPNAPVSLRGRSIKVGWHPDLKRAVVNFQGVSPSAEDIAWAEAYIAAIAEEIGIDPTTLYRCLSPGTN
jgi:hypothetical protein